MTSYGNITTRTLPITSKGQKITEITLRRKKPYTRKELKQIASEMRQKLQTKKFKGSIQVAQFYDELGWKSGKATNIDEGEAELFDMVDYGDRYGHINDNSFAGINMYIYPSAPTRGRTSEKGDCFFQCLRKVLPVDKLYFRTDEELKSYFRIPKNDGVDISLIPKIEKLHDDIALNVSGDHIYTSSNDGHYVIHLKLINGHYTVDAKAIKTGKVRTCNIEKTPLVYVASVVERQSSRFTSLAKDDNIMDCHYYDSENKYRFERVHQNHFEEKGSPFLNLPAPRATDPKEYLDEFIRKATELKSASNGDINMFKTGDAKNSALDYFYRLNKGLDVEPIDQHEAQWIEKCTMGAMIFTDNGYQGKGYEYDFVSHYPSIMKDKFFRFPIRRGQFTRLDNLDLKHVTAGIYRARISSINPKLFRFNPYHYYTHTDITLASKLSGTIKLIQDDMPNFLSYPPDTMVSGEKVFGSFVKHLFELKQNKISGAKDLLNILWGGLCQRFRTKIIKRSGNVTEDIEFVKPLKDGSYSISTFNMANMYQTSYARLAPFLLASGRKKIIEAMKDHIDCIVRCHTDSMLTTCPLNIKSGDNIGNLKYVRHYDDCILKGNRVFRKNKIV